jgi:hypothetical protein
MTFDAATSETIVDSPDAKNDAVLVRRHPAGRVRCNSGTNKVLQRLLQLRTRPCVSLLVMTRLAAALWPSRREERRVGALSAVLG